MGYYNQTRGGITVRIPILEPVVKDEVEVFKHQTQIFGMFMEGLKIPDGCWEFIVALSICYETGGGEVDWKRIFDQKLARAIATEIDGPTIKRIISRFRKQRERLFEWQERNLVVVAGRLTRPLENFNYSWEYKLDFWPFFVSCLKDCPIGTPWNATRRTVKEEVMRLVKEKKADMPVKERKKTKPNADLNKARAFFIRYFRQVQEESGTKTALDFAEMDLKELLLHLKDLPEQGEELLLGEEEKV